MDFSISNQTELYKIGNKLTFSQIITSQGSTLNCKSRVILKWWMFYLVHLINCGVTDKMYV